MPIVREILGKSPQLGANCWLAETATVLGDVTMGDECSVWYNAVLRGDVDAIRIGNRVNIQDGAIVHCSTDRTPTVIGDNVTVGHNAIVHGCKLHDNVLIGMGAIVLDGAVVHSGSIVAAGSVVLENTEIPSGCIYAGTPAKKVKELSVEQAEAMIAGTADGYVHHKEWYREG